MEIRGDASARFNDSDLVGEKCIESLNTAPTSCPKEIRPERWKFSCKAAV